ncbi:MAG: ATP-binding protein [archaeon]|nr:ATP-binding protein [archaeon]
MLTRVSVTGLFNEINYDIQLMDGPITFIHAQNGQGKSTLVKLICNILQGNLEEVRTVPFQRLDLFFDNNSRLIVTNRNQELSTIMQKNRVEEEIPENVLADVLSALYIDPERLYTCDDLGNLVPSIDLYMKELSDSIRRAIGDSMTLPAVESDEKLTDADLDQMFKNIEAKLNFIRQAGFQPTIPSNCKFPPTRYEISEKHDRYRSLALSLRTYADRYYPLAESIVIYLDIINTLFVNKRVDINDKGFLQATMDRSGTIIPLNRSSSGEKQILIMFYLLLFKASPGSLVVIDEPEVSLHVSWQQQLGKFISDIARVRELKVIISTHAPAVIHDRWDCAVELGDSRTN